jgi:hypothetical protein
MFVVTHARTPLPGAQVIKSALLSHVPYKHVSSDFALDGFIQLYQTCGPVSTGYTVLSVSLERFSALIVDSQLPRGR